MDTNALQVDGEQAAAGGMGANFETRHECPGCGSTAYRKIFSSPYRSPLISQYLSRHYGGLARLDRLGDATFTVCRCDRCTLLFQPLAPAGDLLQEIYDCWIATVTGREEIHKSEDLQASRYRIDQVEYLIQAAGLRPVDVRFLDFGCGWSEWLLVARAFGCDVAGSELSEHRTQYAANLGLPMLDWNEIAQQRFNIINLEQVLEHLVDPGTVLSHLAGSLDKGGILRVSVPGGRAMVKRLAALTDTQSVAPGWLMPIQPLEHLNCFTYDSLAAIGQRAGLRLAKPSLRQLYDSVSGWGSLKGAARNLLRPIYRHIYPKSTIVYFTRT